MSLRYKSLCRDPDGEPPDRHDSVRTPIGGDIEFVLCASPRRNEASRSEAALPIDTVLSSAAQMPTLFGIDPEVA